MNGDLPLVPFPRAVRRLSGGPARLPVTASSPDVPEAVLRRVSGGRPESYRLRSDARGVTIEGVDAAGLAHGARTLAQLARREGEEWVVPAVEIDDAPRFSHRGLLLDVARHFFGVDVVCRVIDAIAACKLNVLHLHLSDDQGWRLAMTSRPDLAARASGSAIGGDPGGCYTAEDYRAILAHAASRQVTVVPEIDGPGHTHAVGLAYPELLAEPVVTDEVRAAVDAYGGGLPVTGVPYTGLAVGFSSLRIGDPAVEAFLDDVFGELAALTPGPYVHVGGDEALGTRPEAYAAYLRGVTERVRRLGKTPIAWHEAGGVAAPGTVGQYWGFRTPIDDAGERARAFVRAGGRVILSPADAVYLDMKPDADSRLGLVWANGPTSLADAYDWDPATLIEGIGEADVLGVEAALWTETIRTEGDIEQMLWPRLYAAAEIAWTPAEERDVRGFTARVEALSARSATAGGRAVSEAGS
ncbi:family 20 glycosylhydrolase [Microbacterium sp. SORGH_AS_0888]|uniref:family 20 glycosylhydrolase n=1 Tax=Microbacterium sp. SORGH_AS_0888 TaxID=3041791 RepID=UPI00278A8C75|nr:family 20 glycosylhydrolase [Microbacterium sp. SORGH_AS_0888]MDQ1131294.1 hexosaminidase [Microbacterium sp. SORGH_AS_0888]